MPCFLFQCQACGVRFDVFRTVAMRDEPGKCRECGGGAVRVFTPCHLRQPCADWGRMTARDLLGPDDEAARGRVTVTKGAGKIAPRV